MPKKNKDNLFEDQELLQELLYTKYNIQLVHGVLPVLLISVKNQIVAIEDAKAYQRFKKLILSKHPTTPIQFIDGFLDEFEAGSCKEMQFLSKLSSNRG